MKAFDNHILLHTTEARGALKMFDRLTDSVSRTLFVVDEQNKMVGALTDGDIRRGLLNNLEISNPVSDFMNSRFRFLTEGNDNVSAIRALRQDDIRLVPLLDAEGKIINLLDLVRTRTMLPLAALIMAGGKGERLRPYTDTVPKPMLMVGNKPILEHNIDRLISYGITQIFISVKHLKEAITSYFGDGSSKGVSITYIEESEPLGTLGALSLIDDINHQDILVMNSDILTNIDFEDLYGFYKVNEADMVVASIPYKVNVPYAVLETRNHEVVAFTEKPTYDYYSNGGIYILQFALRSRFEKGSFFNATDMMSALIEDQAKKLVHYPLLNYWLDIGRPGDYLKAQEDIKHLVM